MSASIVPPFNRDFCSSAATTSLIYSQVCPSEVCPISSRVVDKKKSKTILLALDEYRIPPHRQRNDSGSHPEVSEKAVTRGLIGNFDYKVLLGGIGDLESLETFSKLIGYKETTKRSVSKSSSGMSRTES